MISIRHMTILTGRCGSSFWQITLFFHCITCAVFRAAPHFPLGMIITHMALLAGFGVQRLFFGEGMTGMTLITGIVLIFISLGTLFFFLFLGFNTHVMASTTAAAAFH